MFVDMLLSGQSLQALLPFLLSWIVAITIALTVHEFAHAYAADRVGDPTARNAGRVSLNPIAHYDTIGTTMILLFGFGWGKPVPVNPMNFRKPRRDNFIVSAAGIGTNLALAALLSLPIRFGIAGDYLLPLTIIVFLNLLLAFFNLLPLGPLDGAHIVESILPAKQSRAFSEWSHEWGGRALLLLIAAQWIFGIPVLRFLIMTPVSLLGTLFAGPTWPF